jgi:16S rRNA (guanine527-N7)-methyltransferase
MMQDMRIDVSRETMERLALFEALVQKWSPRINLVSKPSLADLWARHIWDSAQVYSHAEDQTHWVDIGSGGGFPALIMAILAKKAHPQRRITMIESDARKSMFLRTVVRELDLNGTVLVQRIESAPPQAAEILSARALADLNTLLTYAELHLDPKGQCLFMKGESWQAEVTEARKNWDFSLDPQVSQTNPQAAILKIKDIARV